MKRRRTLIPLVALVAALALAPAALARGGAGHNSATKKLEDAFKVALYVRSVSKDGCYPRAPRLAKAISQPEEGPSRRRSQAVPDPSTAGTGSS